MTITARANVAPVAAGTHGSATKNFDISVVLTNENVDKDTTLVWGTAASAPATMADLTASNYQRLIDMPRLAIVPSGGASRVQASFTLFGGVGSPGDHLWVGIVDVNPPISSTPIREAVDTGPLDA